MWTLAETTHALSQDCSSSQDGPAQEAGATTERGEQTKELNGERIWALGPRLWGGLGGGAQSARSRLLWRLWCPSRSLWLSLLCLLLSQWLGRRAQAPADTGLLLRRQTADRAEKADPDFFLGELHGRQRSCLRGALHASPSRVERSLFSPVRTSGKLSWHVGGFPS